MNKLAFFLWSTALCELLGILVVWFLIVPERRGEPLHLCLLYFTLGFTPIMTAAITFLSLPNNETRRNS